MYLVQSLRFNEILIRDFHMLKGNPIKIFVGTNPCFFYYILLSTITRENFPIWVNILICGAASSRYQNCLSISYSPVKCIARFLV